MPYISKLPKFVKSCFFFKYPRGPKSLKFPKSSKFVEHKISKIFYISNVKNVLNLSKPSDFTNRDRFKKFQHSCYLNIMISRLSTIFLTDPV